VSFEANGTTVMFVGIVGHGKWVSALIPLSFPGGWVWMSGGDRAS
jgi:hypothetical protein